MEWQELLAYGKKFIIFCLNRMPVKYDTRGKFFSLASIVYKAIKDGLLDIGFLVAQFKLAPYYAKLAVARTLEQDPSIIHTEELDKLDRELGIL